MTLVACAVTGEMLPDTYAIRFVARPLPDQGGERMGGLLYGDRGVTAVQWYPSLKGTDFKGAGFKEPGFHDTEQDTDMWLTPTPEVLSEAFRNLGLGYTPAPTRGSAALSASQSGGWRSLLEDLVLKRLQSAIALSRRAGNAVCGTVKVADHLKKAHPSRQVVVFGAATGSQKQWSRLVGSFAPVDVPATMNNSTRSSLEITPVVTCQILDESEIGLAFGRSSVVHASVVSMGFSRRLIGDASRLRALRRR